MRWLVGITFWKELTSNNYHTGIVCVNEGDDIVHVVHEYHNNNKDNLINLQKMNRYVFQQYFSGLGFTQQLVKIYSTTT